MSSILEDVKHVLGLDPSDTVFDVDVKMHVNSVFSTLCQIGVGPPEGFEIVSGSENWEQFVVGPPLNAVKSYIYLRVRLLFDPPTTGFTLASFERQIQELEWRLNVEVDDQAGNA